MKAMTRNEKLLLIGWAMTILIFAAMYRDMQRESGQLRGKSAIQRPAVEDVEGVTLALAQRPFRGSAEARVAVVEYSDYQCPFSARHMREVAPRIESEYVRTNQVRYYFRDFPLAFHAHAMTAAHAARCAHEQGKFWEMHDQLYANAESQEAIFALAERLEVDMEKFKSCMDSRKHEQEIRREMETVKNAGIRSTPSFLLGYVDPSTSEVRVAKRITGAESFEAFKLGIELLLAERK